MPLRTYRKKSSRRHTRRNTRRHTRQCRHTRQGRYRGGNYTDATTKEMGGYPLNPEKTVIIGSDGQARSYADHKKRDEELYLRIPEY
jgi:hypothetical protein